MSSTHVLKFGGTSLRDAPLINQAADMIAERRSKADPVVVVSAVAGVTDQLLALANDGRATTVTDVIHKIEAKHLDLLNQVGTHQAAIEFELQQLFEALEAAFNDRDKRQATPGAWRDELLSFGERASVRLMEAALAARGVACRQVESQHLIATDATFGEARVMSDLTTSQIRQSLRHTETIPVVTGFIGSTKDGHVTTLGRSGSDYTASLVAGALCADLLEIWTDVDGVLTADPKIVPSAQSIEVLSFDDIAELSAHGAHVIHPKTIDPLRNCNISIKVRNSLNPAHPGTKISKTFSSNGHFRSVTVTGPFTHVQIPGSSSRSFFQWLSEKISSSGTDRIDFYRPSAAEPAQFMIPDDVYHPIELKLQQWLSDNGGNAEITENLFQMKKFSNALLESDQSISSILQALDRQNIHPIRWHRGHNRRYVSLLLTEAEARRAARIINDLINAKAKTTDLFIAGTGAVGGTLIDQIKNLDDSDLQLIGSCNSKNVQWSNAQNEEETQPTKWPNIVKELTTKSPKDIIFVDATGSEEVARLYPQLFEAGIHIVTPSKLANTFEQDYYDKLRKTATENDARFRYETTVGAGLPVISTIEDLQNTGDRITEISGVVSGTMTYLFNQLEEGVPFSKAIIDAREKGYAEPDPRDDLSGEDVARKFLTLARETSLKIDRNELEVQSLIPEELADVNSETFMERLPEFDAYWHDKLARAQKAGATLRYTGRLADGKISIGVEEVASQSAFGQLKGTDNLIRIFTERYNETPLIIQGPGAGKDVTAAGVLADVLEVAEE